MKTCLITTIFTLFCVQAISQDWFVQSKVGSGEKGYVVTHGGDTLHGTIMYNYPPVMARKIFFWEEGDDGNRQKFKGSDLKGFYFADTFWESHEFNDGSLKLAASQKQELFLKPKMKGKLNVYEYYIAEITDWVKYEDGVNKIMPTEMQTEILMKKEGEDFVKLNDVRFFQFKKGMSKYLADCESVSKDIADKKLKRAHLWDIFEKYNACD
ncbi:MAG: hypothetical protein AAFZ15_01885 [Bacteroidota bacterium]